MTPLPESFKAHSFHTGIDRIRDAYRASAKVMEDSRLKAHADYDQYEASGEDEREYDEDGILVFSAIHALDYEILNAVLSEIVVRKAFIHSAFHFWEGSARRWTKLPGRESGFLELRRAVKKAYPICPQLSNLNALNNLLKHHNHISAEQLAKRRPDYFIGGNPVQLHLTSSHVEEAFETVRNSGPKLK